MRFLQVRRLGKEMVHVLSAKRLGQQGVEPLVMHAKGSYSAKGHVSAFYAPSKRLL